jgi:hypothetical protein
MAFFGIYSICGILILLNSITTRLYKNIEVLILVMIIIYVTLIKINSSLSNYNFFALSHGKYNFFENNKEKYNSLIFVSENLTKYNKYFYIDPDFSSSQWAFIGFLDGNLPSINKNQGNGLNASKGDLSPYIQDFSTQTNILAIDPTRYLEANCQANTFINKFVITKKVAVYPAFDINHQKENCTK